MLLGYFTLYFQQIKKKFFLYESLNSVLFPEFIIFELLHFIPYLNNNCPFSSTRATYCLYFLPYLSSRYSIPILQLQKLRLRDAQCHTPSKL